MSWSQEQVTLLIESYKEEICLYQVKSTEYKNKHARQAALERIKQNLVLCKPDVTINDIKNKFSALRQNFNVEHRKHQNSLIRSGTGADDVSNLQFFTSFIVSIFLIADLHSNYLVL